MVVGEVLQGVPVLVVDFILQPGNESSKEKESAGLRGALRSTPRCRLPAASVATPRRSRPGSPGSPVRLPPPAPHPRPLLCGAGPRRREHTRRQTRSKKPPKHPPLPLPSAAHARPGMHPLRHRRGCCFPSGAHAQARRLPRTHAFVCQGLGWSRAASAAETGR